MFVLAILIAATAHAEETGNKAAGIETVGITSDAKATTDKGGPWIGVIEDIQDVDTYAKKLAEEQKYKGPTVRAVIGGIIDGLTAPLWLSATGHTVGQDIANDRLFTSQRDADIRDYVIFFRDENTKMAQKIHFTGKLNWNTGDKIRVSRNAEDPSQVDIAVLEMGELSRYAAKQEAARDK